jgi:8-oxo-dGTP pyrophosphatase MutT (NUDIX family)
MSLLKVILGRIIYFFAYPIIALAINGSTRSRIFLTSENHSKLLVVKDLVGTGTWALPGGGLHKNEDPVDCVIRELKEEIGIKLTKKDLTFWQKKEITEKCITATQYYYLADIPKCIPLTKQRLEILDAKWEDISLLPKLKLSKDLATILNQDSKL